MKQYIFAAAAALALGVTAPTLSAQAYSNPTGYTTETLKAGQFNLMGLTVHQPIITAGVFDQVYRTGKTFLLGSNTLPGEIVNDGFTYVLEITSGPLEGVIQEVTITRNYQIATPDPIGLQMGDIAGQTGEWRSVDPGVHSYALRKASTIADVFGAENEAGLQASANADPSEADVIYIFNSEGAPDRYFYSTLAGFVGWVNADTFAVEPDAALVYTDALIVQRRGVTDLDLVISGAVKTSSTTVVLDGSFNYIGSAFPVGSTLDSTGLAAVGDSQLTTSANADPSEADIVYLPQSSGGFARYFYSTLSGFDGWLNADDFSAAGTVPVTSGVIIQNRTGTSKNANIAVPSSWSL